MSAKIVMKIQMTMNQKKKTTIAHRNDPNDHSVANMMPLFLVQRMGWGLTRKET